MTDFPICSPSPKHRRAELVAWLEGLLEDARLRGLNTWYRWGGSGSLADGVDCSGLIVHWARRLGIDAPRWNTDRMWQELAHVSPPEPGDLALYGRGEKFDPASHVMIVMGAGAARGLYRVAGMSGGGSKTTSIEIARAQGARLREFDSHLYRRDFLGFVRLPFEGAEEDPA